MRRRIAYLLFDLGGRLLPADEKARLLRVLRTGDPDERVPVDEVVLSASFEPSGPEATSDEPARCPHGRIDPHPVYYRTSTGAHDWAGDCPGPAASGTTDGGR